MDGQQQGRDSEAPRQPSPRRGHEGDGGRAQPPEGAAADGAAAPGPKDSGDGLWVLSEEERTRKLEDVYDVPEKEMGRGHYGVVRKGIRKSDGGRVAVKTIPKRRAVYIEMLRNEIDILKRLGGQPHVISLHDAFEDSQQVHLVFELCTGGELFEPIADQGFRFSERQAARLVRRVILAVKACHDVSICHRDLKPENVLMTAPGIDSELKVIDFGLATKLDPGEVLTRHVGTPYYIAPEVLEKRYGLPCDLWSVGVIAFTLLCGFPPFWGDTEREIYGRVRRGHYAFEGPDWSVRSSYSKDFISRLLAMNPRKRPTADEALLHPWIQHEGEVPEAGSRRLVARLRLYSSQPWLKRVTACYVAETAIQSNSNAVEWVRGLYDSYCPASASAPAPASRVSHGGEPGAHPGGGDGASPSHHPGTGPSQPPLPLPPGMLLPDLQAALRARGLHFTLSESRYLFAGLDVDGDGTVSLLEFAAPILPRLSYLADSGPLLAVFARLDADGDGLVTVPDLLTSFPRLATADARAALIEADLDGDGALSVADFMALVGGGEAHIL